ncbi:MAG: hypothetical protein WD894_17315 [Pirellulales bacterium]
MWPRVAEIALGGWLITSLFVFEPSSIPAGWRANNLACGVLIVALAALSFWPPLSRAHLAEIAVGLWLVGFAFASSVSPPPPVVQNAILVALVLLNFAIVPSRASLPPRSWREFYAKQSTG